MKINTLFSLLFAAFALFSCSSDEMKSPAAPGGMQVEISHFFGDKALILGSETYQNAAGESLKINQLRYFVSNFKLTQADGTEFLVPQDQCYFLVDESTTMSKMLSFSDIPAGDYTGLEFMLGVDSLRNTKEVGERAGSLDIGSEAAGMYWSWNSGYIFFKMEGESEVSDNGKFRYHIGGFGGIDAQTLNNIKTVRLPLPKAMSVSASASPMIHLSADLAKVFTGKNQLKIAENPTVMFNDFSVKVAENYSEMFRADHVH